MLLMLSLDIQYNFINFFYHQTSSGLEIFDLCIYLYLQKEYVKLMDVEEIRKILDTKKPEDIRKLVNKQDVQTENKLSIRELLWWAHILLIPVFLTFIFLSFNMMIDDASTSQMLFVVFLISFVLIIITSLKIIQNKNRQLQKPFL